MALEFTPKTWQNDEDGGTPILAEELNRIEQGIVQLTEALNRVKEYAYSAPIANLITTVAGFPLDASMAPKIMDECKISSIVPEGTTMKQKVDSVDTLKMYIWIQYSSASYSPTGADGNWTYMVYKAHSSYPDYIYAMATDGAGNLYMYSYVLDKWTSGTAKKNIAFTPNSEYVSASYSYCQKSGNIVILNVDLVYNVPAQYTDYTIGTLSADFPTNGSFADATNANNEKIQIWVTASGELKINTAASGVGENRHVRCQIMWFV